VAETITLCRSKGHRDPKLRHERAVQIGRQLRSGVFGHVHHATPEEGQAAFEYFERHADKDYSFVDCLSFVMMRKLGITEAWAVDSDFTHRGFLVRPGPRPPSRKRDCTTAPISRTSDSPLTTRRPRHPPPPRRETPHVRAGSVLLMVVAPANQRRARNTGRAVAARA
jgi:predicted nucleic acid-binding protein